MPATTLTAGDATNGSAVTAGGNDGTLKLQTGPAGAKVDAVAFASDGTPTFIKQPVLPVQSMVRMNATNGYGSTNTCIPRFLTTVTNQGTDITYADSATLGASFTINTSGVYGISITLAMSAASAAGGISVNSTQLTTNIASITAADRLVHETTATTSARISASITIYLAAGAVVRPHADASALFGSEAQFTITRVA